MWPGERVSVVLPPTDGNQYSRLKKITYYDYVRYTYYDYVSVTKCLVLLEQYDI